MRLPFAHLNLRRNPFGELPLTDRGKMAVPSINLESIIAQLEKPRFAVQFLGDKGRGKTTHLLALRVHFPEAPYIHIGEQEPVPRIPRVPLVFLDEMQRIPPRQRKRLFKRNTSWVIGTHEDHQVEMERAGLEVHMHRFCGLDVEQLVTLANRRISMVVRDIEQPVPVLDASSAQRLIRLYSDDVRAIEGHLYDVFQNMRAVGYVKV